MFNLVVTSILFQLFTLPLLCLPWIESFHSLFFLYLLIRTLVPFRHLFLGQLIHSMNPILIRYWMIYLRVEEYGGSVYLWKWDGRWSQEQRCTTHTFVLHEKQGILFSKMWCACPLKTRTSRRFLLGVTGCKLVPDTDLHTTLDSDRGMSIWLETALL